MLLWYLIVVFLGDIVIVMLFDDSDRMWCGFDFGLMFWCLLDVWIVDDVVVVMVVGFVGDGFVLYLVLFDVVF